MNLPVTAESRFQEYLSYFKKRYYRKDVEVDLLGLGLLAKEHVFLQAPPGHAKSMLAEEFLSGIRGAKVFALQLGEGITFEDIFGRVNTKKWREDAEVSYITEGSLVEADFALLDEMMDAPPRVLRLLLSALNERKVRMGAWAPDIPLQMAVATTNFLPQDPKVDAVVDRFIFRKACAQLSSADAYEAVANSAASLEPCAPPPLFKKDLQLIRARRPVSRNERLAREMAAMSADLAAPVSPRRFALTLKAFRFAPLFSDPFHLLAHAILPLGAGDALMASMSSHEPGVGAALRGENFARFSPEAPNKGLEDLLREFAEKKNAGFLGARKAVSFLLERGVQ